MQARETAVILIEFQNEFCKEGGKFYDAHKDEILRLGTTENGAKLAKAAREKGCLIIHSPYVFDEKWADEVDIGGIIGEAKKIEGCFRPDTWGVEIIDEMKPEPGDVVLKGKRALSAFTNTGLAKMLEDHGTKNVVCAGFQSNCCVVSTARYAYDQGYRIHVVKDATATTSKDDQEHVESVIYPLLGNAMTVEEFISALE